MGIAKFVFRMRTYQPIHMDTVALFFNNGLRGTIEEIVVYSGPLFSDMQWRIASLHIRLGVFGLYSAVEATSYSFVASRAQSWVL